MQATVKRPRRTRVTEVVVQRSIEKAVPSVSEIPKRERANITARFHGPRPPLLGIAMLMELNTNDISAGNRPNAIPCSIINARVNGNAKRVR